MPAYFSPPVRPGRPYALHTNRPYSSLLRHYGGIPTGINVWIVDGEVTTVEPDRTLVDVDAEFLGSHIYEVDDDTAALLVAAGFELLEYTPPAPSVPLPGTPDPVELNDLEPVGGFGTYGQGLYGEGYYGGSGS